jgi:tight adherence protein B
VSASSWSLRTAAAAVAAGALTLLTIPTAVAATSTIDYVEPDEGRLQVVVQLSELQRGERPDLGTVSVSLDGELVPSEAEALGDTTTEEAIERTAVLALDVSNSMRGEKFEAAQAAANAFLNEVPDDVEVGLITFAGEVTEVQAPTTDRDAVREAIADLELSRATLLYDGLLAAIETAGTEGSRSVLLLSDGADTSDTQVADVVSQVEDSETVVDVVALAQTPQNTAILEELASAGNGQVLSAGDPEALTKVFAEQAANLASQVLVTVTPPAEAAGQEGTLQVTLQVDNQPVTTEAFVAVPAVADPASSGLAAPAPVDPGVTVPREYMFAGLGAATLALIVIVGLLSAGSRDPRQDQIDRGIEAYTRKGAQRIAQANRQTENQGKTNTAVAMAESVLEGQKGLEQKLGDKLDAAGMALKPAEWLLVHVGVTLGLGIIGLLLSGGNVLFMLAGLLFGGFGAWAFLSMKHTRRLKAFKNQLADTLQLMAGALSAGLSLAQSVDTVVKEGTDPMAGEFRRALIETRLGVEIEDALAAIADRMSSVDFEWVVMAIRIQRQVGGNLAELLNKVAETIREREYLERQVLTLSAEGRLSVWILGGLPPAFMAYLLVSNPGYVGVLFESPIGWAMLILMGFLLTVGIFWMKKLVKVEV